MIYPPKWMALYEMRKCMGVESILVYIYEIINEVVLGPYITSIVPYCC